jgi:autotransporter-associated beta strand protein
LNWDDSGNWDPEGVPDTLLTPADTYHVIFDSDPGGTVSLNGNREIATLDVQHAFDIDSSGSTNTLTISGGYISSTVGTDQDIYADVALTQTTTVYVTGGSIGHHFTIFGNLISTSDLTKTGTGRFGFGANNVNTFTGDTTIAEGAINMDSYDGLGGAANTVTIKSGAEMNLHSAGGTLAPFHLILETENGTNGVVTVRGATISGPVSGGGEIQKTSGNAGFTLSGDAGSFTGSVVHTDGNWTMNSALLGTTDIRCSADGHDFGGNGTIRFTVDGNDHDTIVITNGATFVISSMGLDIALTNKQSLLEYVIADFTGGTNTTRFVSTNGLPEGADVDYDGTDRNPGDKIVLVLPPPPAGAIVFLK